MSGDPEPEAAPEEYALVEIMGHRRHYGTIAEVLRFGVAMILVHDLVNDVVHFYGGPAIYGITNMPKDECLAAVAQQRKWRTPPSPAALPAPGRSDLFGFELEEEDEALAAVEEDFAAGESAPE